MDPVMDPGARESTHGDESTLAGDDTPVVNVPPSHAVQRGDMVGRYLVLAVLGHGTMGVVYSAHDPDLDRKVALKIVTTPYRAGPLAPAARELLLREAQSLARLSHPNVVTVHDVGEISGGIFIAMEYVQGRTLRQWWTQEQPSWPRIRDVCVEAGRGLAAAHRAGLVHRDFKPENVMVDVDGRARVLDFGLARPESEVTPSRQGTPAYMAPEALEGQCDARSDQFSFCVTVWELVFGERPFAGLTAMEITSHALAGRVSNPRRFREVPRRVRQALLRGLDSKPHARFESMDALLGQFDDEPDRRRRRRRVTAIGVTAIAAVGLAAWNRGRVHCTGEETRALSVWSAQERGRVTDRLERVAPTFGHDVATRVAERMDAHVHALADALVGACEARQRGRTSETIATVTEVCLEQNRLSLEAVTEVLREADERTAAAALDVVESLRPVEECSHAAERVEFREGLGEPSADSLRRRLARAGALVEAGRAQEALELTLSLVHETEALGWPAFSSRAAQIHSLALWDVGRVDESERSVLRAIDFAAQANDDAMAMAAWGRLLDLFVDRGRASEALTVEPAVRAAYLRAGKAHTPRLHNAIGSALMLLGRFDEAEQRYQRAIEEYSNDDREPMRATAPQVNLAVLRVYQGRFAEARDLFGRATDVYASWRGADHPETWTNRVNQADTLVHLGETEAAARIYMGAIGAFEAVQGVDSIEAARARQHLAEVRLSEGQIAEAERELTRALQVLEQTVGKGHPYAAAAVSTRATLRAAQGQLEQAEADFVGSTAILVAAVGKEHPVVGWNHALLGRFRLARGELERAEESLVAAEAPLGRYGESNTMLVPVLTDRAAIHLERGELAEAEALLERAGRIVSQAAIAPVERGRYALRTAVLAALRGNDEAARRHGRAAEAAFAGLRTVDALPEEARRIVEAPGAVVSALRARGGG